MSVLKKAVGAVGGLALLALPVVAQAAPAASRLSLNAAPQVKSGARIGADRKDESKATSGVVLGVLAIAEPRRQQPQQHRPLGEKDRAEPGVGHAALFASCAKKKASTAKATMFWMSPCQPAPSNPRHQSSRGSAG